MMQSAGTYFATLNAAAGDGWNRFWFTPASAETLGVMRIAAGALSLYTIGAYGPDLQYWFSTSGMLPTEMIHELYPAQWSLWNYVAAGQLRVVHYAALAVLALFTLGVGGRAVAIASAVIVLSYFNRAPVVTGAFEPVLAFLMVYLCIGRAGDQFSAQGALTRRTGGQDRHAVPTASNRISLRLIQVHVALVHLMMGLAQLSAAEGVWWSGEGIWLAASRPGMALVELSWLAEAPKLAAAWSHTIVLFLLALPVFVWIPLMRPLMLAAGALVWLSLAIATGWITFCAAMCIGLAAFMVSDQQPNDAADRRGK